ncbi:DUF3021 domain-containing protein (plasmid) [Clostridium estertheticum]|uniref:DUF3021 family protein n=1 Tax=Clostridium estertheticum TaxID=238834 RepID=UPI001C0C6B16|nr:DUF3021 family protein [Clostridium estertheticum]MBU3217723.1 DUF3021 domain-containing protein [Clostridium estertheticum]WAG58301.1 DUF3021 domain-containing protein [Clostridium estertheticum]
MKVSEFIKKLIKDYFVIFGVVVFVVTALNSESGFSLNIKDLYTVMIGALAGDLTSFILYSPNEMSGKETRVRICIHFITLEVILLLLAHILGIAGGYIQLAKFALEIAVIYLVIRFLSWQVYKKDAKEINGKLKNMKKLTSHSDK